MSDISIEKQENNISFRFDYTSYCTYGVFLGVCLGCAMIDSFTFDRTFTMHWHVYAPGFLPVG